MRAVLLLIAGVIAALVLVPPLFTHGECTAEFDAAGNLLEAARPQLATLARAREFLTGHAIAYRVISLQECENAPLPPDVESCPEGPLLLGAVPVRNRVCRYYRDATIRLQLRFNPREQLVRIQTDMNPYRILRLPWKGYELYLGR